MAYLEFLFSAIAVLLALVVIQLAGISKRVDKLGFLLQSFANKSSAYMDIKISTQELRNVADLLSAFESHTKKEQKHG